MTRTISILLPAVAAALALVGYVMDVMPVFWTGAVLALVALVRRLRMERNSQAAVVPGIAILCGGTFVHPWFFGLAAGLCVWAAVEAVRRLRPPPQDQGR